MALINRRVAPMYKVRWSTAAKDRLLAWPEFPTRPGESSFMLMKTLATLAFTTGVTLSGSVLADPAKFDGTWSVSLVANGGLCGSGASSTLTVQNGSVRAGGSGVSVSGQVAPSGSVSLALQKSGVQGTASGKLSGSSGSGSWSVSSLGCSGRWTAQRRTLTAQAN